MHLPELFPHFFILQRLVDGSLNQSQNLITAMRRWILINWFYGEASKNLECDRYHGITFNEWSEYFFNQDLLQLQASFKSGHPLGRLLEKNDEIFKSHHPLCPCYKTTVDWLRFYNINVDDWLEELQKNIYISQQTVNKVIRDRLFAKVRKSLQADINALIAKECLKYETSLFPRQNIIYRVDKLPDWLASTVAKKPINSHGSFPGLNSTEMADLAQALDMLSFLDPKLAPIADKISGEVYGTRRIFLHVDYILSQENQLNIDNLQEQLQENWQSREIKPIFLNYASARCGDKQCLVYPVCIYYLQRAKYLCGYGLNPQGDVNWYIYRLERIKSFTFVDWSNPIIPPQLLSQYLNNQLPEPHDVEKQISNAWGFEINKPPCLMLLRFNRDYHQRYIHNTFRHDTFTRIKSPTKLLQIINHYTSNPKEAKLLNNIIKKYPDDAYYSVIYRAHDNNIIMRLLAWGGNVEVLLPMELRKHIANNIRQAYTFYDC
ncbi:TIGR03985 family CRISPR-associated protein [Tolypothrix sp. FACHB-123]|uniref:TIGR03985 family CRISPR-associated protein n=1 Tax=Tolypothrix sp. FACHB-123 TaxID=2692868 RepID=UPI001684C495|nr:TIGR03985 family CRISPR-associated protein [Tolypothrix sp. FACHB-123]MBD2359521.1 TIGR03985 family CRISPR-associated protein [Tolypothrix sp. FACHB-123]